MLARIAFSHLTPKTPPHCFNIILLLKNSLPSIPSAAPFSLLFYFYCSTMFQTSVFKMRNVVILCAYRFTSRKRLRQQPERKHQKATLGTYCYLGENVFLQSTATCIKACSCYDVLPMFSCQRNTLLRHCFQV